MPSPDDVLALPIDTTLDELLAALRGRGIVVPAPTSTSFSGSIEYARGLGLGVIPTRERRQ